MYIFIFMVHLFFCSCSFVWSLGFRNIYSVEKMYIFTFCFSIFFFFCFFFSWTTLHFFKCLLQFVGLFRSNVLSLHRGQRILKLFFGFFRLFSCFCIFSSSSVVFYVFVLTLLVDVFSFLLFLFVYGLCFVGPSTSVQCSFGTYFVPYHIFGV